MQEEMNTYKGVHRIIRHAFEFARAYGRPTVCMADKSNAMPDGHALWQRVFREESRAYPEIDARHLYIDALALLMVQNPSQFERHRHQQPVRRHHHGSRRRASGRSGRGGVRQHASRPDVDVRAGARIGAAAWPGRMLANPMGAILSAALMLAHIGWTEESAIIDAAVQHAVVAREGTADIGGVLGTRETGDRIAKLIHTVKT